MDFKRKVVLITGGCSGIGKIMSRKVLERGVAHLILLDINEQGLMETKNEFSGFNIPISTYPINLAEREEIIITSEKIKNEIGDIDVLINNAGVVTGKYFHEHSHDQIDFNISINSLAPMHLTLEFLPRMVERNSGHVCTIASSAGLVSNPKMSVYAASKWAALGWSDSVRLEMEKLNKNIHFTSFLPYYINTGMFDGVKSRLIPILDPEKTAERIINSIEKQKKIVAIPLPFWFIRLSQGIFPLKIYDWLMGNILGIYDTMSDFKGRKY